MAEEKVGILRAIFRFLRFWNWRKARYILEAADEQFTGSVGGISAAFEMHRDAMVKRYQGLRDAIAEVETVLEEKRARLETLNAEEEELLKKRDGAVAFAEKAKLANDDAEYEKHATAFERFYSRIEEIEQTQARLQTEIQEGSKTMNRYMVNLRELQAEIEQLSQQKAEAVADFVSSKQIIELNDRLQGLETSIDRGPIAAVLEANKRLTAKARVTEKLAGADVKDQDREYARAGRISTAREKMDEMLAARMKDRAAVEEPEAPAAETETDSRPKI